MGVTGDFLTAKQQTFVTAFLTTGNASHAYRAAYNVADSTSKSRVTSLAWRAIQSHKVRRAIEEFRAEHQKIALFDSFTIAQMYLEDREFAQQCNNPSAAIAATTGIARLYGLDRQKIELDVSPVQAMLNQIGQNQQGFKVIGQGNTLSENEGTEAIQVQMRRKLNEK